MVKSYVQAASQLTVFQAVDPDLTLTLFIYPLIPHSPCTHVTNLYKRKTTSAHQNSSWSNTTCMNDCMEQSFIHVCMQNGEFCADISQRQKR